MRWVMLLTVVCLAAPERPGPPPRQKPMTFQEQLLGRWQLVSAQIDGRPDEQKKPSTVLHFKPDVIEVHEEGRRRDEDDARYTVDASKSPIAIDLTLKSGKEKRILGIIRVEGDRLTLCFKFSGEGRPTEFVSIQGTDQIVMTLSRVAEKKAESK